MPAALTAQQTLWAPVVLATDLSTPVIPAAHSKSCPCGQWTCVDCQQGCDCLIPALPGMAESPSIQGLPDARAPDDPDSVTPREPSALPPTAEPINIPPVSSLASSQSGVAGGPGLPGMIADSFGGSGGTTSILTDITVVNFQMTATGIVVSGSLDQPGTPVQIVYDVPGGTNVVDLISEGLGQDSNNDGFTNTIGVAEPVPPTDAPTAPGPGFTYDGGVANNVTQVYSGPDQYDVQYSYSQRQRFTMILPSPGGPGGGVVIGRLKIAENNSPMPRDRVFVNYSLFDNVPLVQGGVTVNRFSPGFEKTFWDEMASFELRAPVGATLDSNILSDSGTSMGHMEWGNLFAALKFLLVETSDSAYSAGMGMTIPIADDVRVGTVDQKPLVAVKNEAVHLLPYVGWLHRRSNGFFTHGFAQLDVDLNGNVVEVNVDGRGLAPVGTVQDTTYFHVDWGAGFLHQVSLGSVVRVVPTLELHYTRSLQKTDYVETADFRIGQAKDDFQLLNTVIGCTLDCRHQSSLTVGYVVPIGNGSDQLFDGELRAFWNQYF